MNYKGQSAHKGQGAIEYLLLLAAAVVVVAVVISFMISTVEPVTSSGDKQTYDFVCKQLNTNSLTCGCYMKDSKRGEFVGATYTAAGSTSCPEKLSDDLKTNRLLDWP
jgi:hypothetical protein